VQVATSLLTAANCQVLTMYECTAEIQNRDPGFPLELSHLSLQVCIRSQDQCHAVLSLGLTGSFTFNSSCNSFIDILNTLGPTYLLN